VVWRKKNGIGESSSRGRYLTAGSWAGKDLWWMVYSFVQGRSGMGGRKVPTPKALEHAERKDGASDLGKTVEGVGSLEIAVSRVLEGGVY